MIYLFYFFSVVLILLSYKSLRGGIEYLDYFRRELAKPKSDFTPFVSIIAPCRGVDDGLETNLEKLFTQNFPVYEVIFVVDEEKDEAVKIIKNVSRRGAESAESKLVIAGKAENEGQKVYNLREAVLNVSEKSEVFVFVDSDARPNENWLRNLIAPLHDEKIGCSTGYRWFISEQRNFASEMLSVWNASIASSLGANLKSNFCWGGSMALRRETFEKVKMRERLKGTLSDDFTITRTMNEFGLPIFFVPQALTVSVENCSLKKLFEFTTRQMKITRVYAPHLWKASFIGSFLFNFVLIWAFFIIGFYTFKSFPFWFAVFTILTVSTFSIDKSALRLKAVELVLKDHQA
ncbi:MAG: glycosyltransferase, partial [Pyrinomonadaceae bacterium]